MSKLIDLTGKKFGRWTIVKKSESKGHHTAWFCRCECGIEKVVLATSLRKGVSKSCGCLNKELASSRNIKHGHFVNNKQSPEYKSWAGMIERCTNENNNSFINYGFRGITVCERWLNSFEDFLKDMGEKPSKEHSIERKDANGDYEPSNCIWATPLEQSRNRRTPKNNSSGVKGVSFNKNMNKYHARINVDYKIKHLGYFNTLEEATKARKQAELKYWKSS